jgi:diguanylate cyclase (GGDEF)-like protein
MRLERNLFLSAILLCALPGLALVWPWAAAPLASLLGDGQAWLQGLALGLGLLSLAAARLNQTRLVFMVLGLLAATLWLWGRLELEPQAQIRTLDAWLLALPLGLALALLPPEAGLFSRRSAARLALLALPAFLLAAAAGADRALTAQLLGWRAWGPALSAQPSHGAHLSLLAFVGVLAWRWSPKIAPALAVLGGSLLGQYALAWATLMLAAAPGVAARAWLLSGVLQAVLLALALFFMYWQRVYLDELTGIPNRRALDEKLLHLDGPYSLAMVDIDHFKKFNDTYGHDQGDDVLRLVGKHLADGTADRAFRYGGEEFCVLLPGVDSEAAEAILEGVRASLAKQRFHIRLPPNIRKKTGPKDRGSLHAQTTPVQVTISVGVAAPGTQAATPGAVLKLADQGLYRAKENGRNNVARMS